jgi:hypothetical protein
MKYFNHYKLLILILLFLFSTVDSQTTIRALFYFSARALGQFNAFGVDMSDAVWNEIDLLNMVHNNSGTDVHWELAGIRNASPYTEDMTDPNPDVRADAAFTDFHDNANMGGNTFTEDIEIRRNETAADVAIAIFNWDRGNVAGLSWVAPNARDAYDLVAWDNIVWNTLVVCHETGHILGSNDGDGVRIAEPGNPPYEVTTIMEWVWVGDRGTNIPWTYYGRIPWFSRQAPGGGNYIPNPTTWTWNNPISQGAGNNEVDQIIANRANAAAYRNDQANTTVQNLVFGDNEYYRPRATTQITISNVTVQNTGHLDIRTGSTTVINSLTIASTGRLSIGPNYDGRPPAKKAIEPHQPIADKLLGRFYANIIRRNGVTLAYSIPEDCNVDIRLFNLDGKEIKCLSNEYQSKGVHTRNLSAFVDGKGMFLAKIKLGNKIIAKKLIKY